LTAVTEMSNKPYSAKKTVKPDSWRYKTHVKSLFKTNQLYQAILTVLQLHGRHFDNCHRNVRLNYTSNEISSFKYDHGGVKHSKITFQSDSAIPSKFDSFTASLT